MSGPLSAPPGPASTTTQGKVPTTTSRPRRRPPRFNRRNLLVPFAAVSLGTLFFLYSRTSVQAAKDSARRHREADGGTINWRNESMRRHGVLEKPRERSIWQMLFTGSEDEAARERRLKEAKRLELLADSGREKNPIEEGIRRAREGREGSKSDGE